MRPRTQPYFFDTGSGLNFTFKSIVLLSRKSRILHLEFQLLRTADKKPLEFNEDLLLHVRIGYLVVPVWLCVVNRLAVEILAGTSFINRYVRGIFPFVPRINLETTKPIYISAMRRDNENPNISIVKNDVSTVMENPSKSKIRLLWQTAMPLRPKSSVPFVSREAGLRLIESKSMPRWREQVIVARDGATILPLVRF